MNRLKRAIAVIHEMDLESMTRRRRSTLPDVARLLVTLGFLFTVVSFDRYDLFGLGALVVFLLVQSAWEDISLHRGIRRFRYALLLLVGVGIANPFLDRQVYMTLWNVQISGGVLTMCTLFLKGLFAVCACYFLIVQIGVDGLCHAMKSLHVPDVCITVVMLIYRYIIVFLKEIDRMQTAYQLRAPGQRGIQLRSWGAFLGNLLLRSMDRATAVYQCMELRGYDGSYVARTAGRAKSAHKGVIYVLCWWSLFLFLRKVPVFVLVGNLVR
ncbi:MAG: energy-coupling factor transporter transmembrane protein EcfT [Muribaculaceae bacterium]|nr:energy-coupling factor transporter transmembrane protein EcfT [Roseburia sp.]MCM1430894.1 energy-coupling factor transporter transmembrane protein EcfT [Muribaculaceae bacterium]MCM1491745.1 energy-coupling factor transporter transmembrane protein EcfT [Muribaculaceae bacterium]